MRTKFCLRLLIALVALLTSRTSFAQNWQTIYDSPPIKIQYDSSNIEKVGKKVLVHLKNSSLLPPPPQSGGFVPPAYDLKDVVIDCQEATYQEVKSSFFDKNNNIINFSPRLTSGEVLGNDTYKIVAAKVCR